MTLPQIVSVVAAVCVAALYVKDFWPVGPKEQAMLTHLRHILDVRDSYRTPEVASRCNALMEALLGIKQ